MGNNEGLIGQVGGGSPPSCFCKIHNFPGKTRLVCFRWAGYLGFYPRSRLGAQGADAPKAQEPEHRDCGTGHQPRHDFTTMRLPPCHRLPKYKKPTKMEMTCLN
ncbi:MAG: hypothetical protein A3K83_00230 [Omnitrophica WOR_2 bacterium RBG_13_44_8b]|nr:MAG: hypothetical protein A3K83_00230 [Omnitrophica WOR_2 bacterium RBG_13_44_8b]